MDNRFFEHPILNSPYDYPGRYWELDGQGQPTQQIIESRRRAEFITPIPKPKKQKQKANDGHGEDDPLHLVVEIKGYRREDAKEKKSTMETYWVPGVNNSGKYGRWAFTEFTEVYQIESDFKARIESQFHIMIEAYSDAWTSDLRRANEYIASQLGQDGKWARLNDAIWARVRSAEDHAFQLSDLDAVSESVSCSGDEILAVLALLSRKSTGLLKMEFRSESLGGVEILPSEFTRMLTGWWRTKSISENEWREWASSVHVRWVLLGKEGLL